MKFKWLCCAESEESIKQSSTLAANLPAANFARRVSEYLQKNTNALNQLVPNDQPSTESLQISIVESPPSLSLTPFKIFQDGLENSEFHSSTVFFGLDSNKEFCVTSDLNLAEKSLSIFYEALSQKFYLKDLSLNTFIKVLGNKHIEGNFLISFIDKRLIFGANKQVLIVRVPESGEEFEFRKEESPVLIGRSESCVVKLTGKNISRVQCTILYEDGWVLKDGGVDKSRNGTWFMPMEKCEVVDGMVFNANKIIFSVQVMSAAKVGEEIV